MKTVKLWLARAAIGLGILIAYQNLLNMLGIFVSSRYDGMLYGSERWLLYLWWIVIVGAPFAVGMTLIFCGSTSLLRWGRFQFYMSLLNPMEHTTVAELSKATGYSPARVSRDLCGMLRSGRLPGAKFDREYGCLFLSEKGWPEYEQQKTKWKKTKTELSLAGVSIADYLELLQMQQGLADVQKWNQRIQTPAIKEQVAAAHKELDNFVQTLCQKPQMLAASRRTLNFYIPQLLQMTRQYAQLETLGVNMEGSDCAAQIGSVLREYPF